MFTIVLLLVGSAVGGFWDQFIYGHFYVTANYFSDFSPFVPITQGVIDAHFDDYNGHLIGITLGQLQFFWTMFSLATWILAMGIYFRRRWIWANLVWANLVVTRLTTPSSKQPSAIAELGSH